jgi:hypothetical protein
MSSAFSKFVTDCPGSQLPSNRRSAMNPKFHRKLTKKSYARSGSVSQRESAMSQPNDGLDTDEFKVANWSALVLCGSVLLAVLGLVHALAVALS